MIAHLIKFVVELIQRCASLYTNIPANHGLNRALTLHLIVSWNMQDWPRQFDQYFDRRTSIPANCLVNYGTSLARVLLNLWITREPSWLTIDGKLSSSKQKAAIVVKLARQSDTRLPAAVAREGAIHLACRYVSTTVCL